MQHQFCLEVYTETNFVLIRYEVVRTNVLQRCKSIAYFRCFHRSSWNIFVNISKHLELGIFLQNYSETEDLYISTVCYCNKFSELNVFYIALHMLLNEQRFAYSTKLFSLSWKKNIALLKKLGMCAVDSKFRCRCNERQKNKPLFRGPPTVKMSRRVLGSLALAGQNLINKRRKSLSRAFFDPFYYTSTHSRIVSYFYIHLSIDKKSQVGLLRQTAHSD